MASTLVQIRVDEDLKNEATSIFEQIRLDLPTAFRIFLKKPVEERSILFSMRMERKVSLKEEKKAFMQLRKEAKKNGLQEMTLDEINEENRSYLLAAESIPLRILHKLLDDCTAQAFLKRNRSGKAYLCFFLTCSSEIYKCGTLFCFHNLYQFSKLL